MASRILLADDSITIQKVVNLTFADEGIEVVAVSNGDLAVRRLPEVNPDLVLADIFMPGKNGYELCEAIKQNSQFRHVPVVLLVGAFEPFDQVEARRVQADAHLTKPFESRTLVETVRRLISAGKAGTSPIASMPAADDERDDVLDALAPVTGSAFAASQPVKLDLSAMMTDNSVAPSAQPTRSTGELASPTPETPRESLDIAFEAPRVDAASPTLTDTSEKFEPMELSPNGNLSTAEAVAPLDLDPHDMIQNFERSEPIEPPAAQETNSLEAEASALLKVDVSGAGEGGSWNNQGSFDTMKVDRQSDDGRWQVPANGSPLTYQSPDFRLQSEGAYDVSDASAETACATLLAVDEPLGDVLFDERVSVDPEALSRMDSTDSLGLEFIEPEVAEAETPAATEFDLVDVGSESAPEAPMSGEETSRAVESPTVEETSAQEARLEPVASNLTLVSAHVANDVDSDMDWTTPRAATYSTAQLESVVMPINSAEYVAETSEHPSAPEAGTQEASFTTATMWTEDEARFTPIDIEAVAVEENKAHEVSAAETGFAFSSLPTEEPDARTQTPVATNSDESAETKSTVDLSSAAIERIVRRVVAEMSESVVREVAWEVVPDCVERVIDQLTRESVSKRA